MSQGLNRPKNQRQSRLNPLGDGTCLISIKYTQKPATRAKQD